MANLSELIQRVELIVQDSSFTAVIIKGFLNEGVQKLAGGVVLPDGSTTPPLVDLSSDAQVETSTDLPYVALPSESGNTYHRGLFYVLSNSQDREIKIFDSWIKFLEKYRLVDGVGSPGDVEACCVRGQRLYYQCVPATADVLRLHFYRRPVDMSAMSDQPDGIPYHLHSNLLVNYACKEIYGLIEDGVDEKKINTRKYEDRFVSGCYELLRFVGFEDERAFTFEDEYGEE
jgi:hypothetical protein